MASSSSNNNKKSDSKSVKSLETINNDEWLSYFERISLSKYDLNSLISNFLYIEGLESVYRIFENESNTNSINSINLLSIRSEIKLLILNGSISLAINKLNEYNSDILETNNNLLFQLQLQQCIELIQLKQIEKAISFAANNLAPIAMNNSQYLNELESVMSLLVFNDISNSPLSHLIKPTQRYNLAEQVNEAILQVQHQNKDSHLMLFLKKLIYQQKLLSEQAEFPIIKQETFNNPQPFNQTTNITNNNPNVTGLSLTSSIVKTESTASTVTARDHDTEMV